ncbi:HPP family protein [soil metagenome]
MTRNRTDRPDPTRAPRRRWSRYTSTFVDVPAGPDWTDRLRAAVGAVGGIALTGLLCGIMLGSGLTQPLLVAPMGASAVLLFAVPASPLAQPWSITGGNVLSALVGITVARLVPEPTLAAALAVGLSIVTMTLLRCLHPPGGAVALATALGAGSGHYDFALVPVGLNCLMLVATGWLFHRFSGHSYPHRAPAQPAVHATRDVASLDRAGAGAGGVDAAIAAYGDALDVSTADLKYLFKEAELLALRHNHGALAAADIMSRDVITIHTDASVAEARRLLSDRDLLSLPMIDDRGRVVGVVTPLDLIRPGAHARDIASKPLLAGPQTPVADLVRPLSEGRRHEIMIVGADGRLLGMVTQTDLIAALAAAAA